MPQGHFLRREGTPAFHLHLVTADSWPGRKERLLREQETAQAYGGLKIRLAAALRDDPDGYTRGKTAFVQAVMDNGYIRLGLPWQDVWED